MLAMDMVSRQTRKLLAFLEKRPGFEIQQINGQRRYGRPVESAGPSPPKGSEVFVGKLPRDMFEDEIVPLFETNGEIHEVRMMMDFSGTNRGFCFVKFAKPSQAERSVKVLNDFEIRPGKTIGVVKSVDNCRLFFGGLPKDKTEDDLYKELIKHVNDVTGVIMYKSVKDKSKNRGFAFVEFRNHRAAAMARRKLVPNRIMFWGDYLQIDWAVPEPEIDEETMSTVKILFIRNVQISTSEELIRSVMSATSPNSVTRVRKIKDFAFVHFKTREDAERALHCWNGKEIDGSVVEITWAKPLIKANRWQRRVGGASHYEHSTGAEHQQHFVDMYNGHGNVVHGPWSFMVMPPPPIPRFNPQAVDVHMHPYLQEEPKVESNRTLVSPQQPENSMVVHYPVYNNDFGQEALIAVGLPQTASTQGAVEVPFSYVLQTASYIPGTHTTI